MKNLFTHKRSNHTKAQRHKELQKRYLAIHLCAFVPLCEKTEIFLSRLVQVRIQNMKNPIGVFFILFFCLSSLPVYAVDVAPRISDVEIIERLTRLEEGQKRLEDSIKTLDTNLNKRIDDPVEKPLKLKTGRHSRFGFENAKMRRFSTRDINER